MGFVNPANKADSAIILYLLSMTSTEMHLQAPTKKMVTPWLNCLEQGNNLPLVKMLYDPINLLSTQRDLLIHRDIANRVILHYAAMFLGNKETILTWLACEMPHQSLLHPSINDKFLKSPLHDAVNVDGGPTITYFIDAC